MNTSTTMDLLPISPVARIPDNLKFSEILSLKLKFLHILRDALAEFIIYKNHLLFDPHVGDTSCQIRAYYNLLLAELVCNKEYEVKILTKFREIDQLIHRLEKDLVFYKSIEKTKGKTKKLKTTLENFIISQNYYIEIESHEKYLVSAYLLTKFKQRDDLNNFSINTLSAMQFFSFSRDRVRRLIRFYQVYLSEFSVDFIYNLVKELPLKEFKILSLKKLARRDEDNRQTLPCYIVMKIIFKHIIFYNKTVYINIRRDLEGNTLKTLKLKVLGSNNALTNSNYQPNVTINGVVKYKWGNVESEKDLLTKIKSIGFENILFQNMAIHPQYPGKKLKQEGDNPFANWNDHIELLYLHDRKLAPQNGCTQNNPSLFYIEHIYSTLKDFEKEHCKLNPFNASIRREENKKVVQYEQ